MKQRHNKYQGKIQNINMMIFVATMLDPCYKFKFVEWSFRKLYDFIEVKNMTWKVKDSINRMYDAYKLAHGQKLSQRRQPSQVSQAIHVGDMEVDGAEKDSFAVEFYRDMNERDSIERKLGVEQYLFDSNVKWGLGP